MFLRLGNLVTRHWLLTIMAWVVAAGGLHAIAPRWEDIAHDGDLAYLPAGMSSVRGERLMAEAFPAHRAKSQIVIVTARDLGPLEPADIYVAYDLARRFQNLAGVARIHQARALLWAAEQVAAGDADSSVAVSVSGPAEGEPAEGEPAEALRQRAQQALAEAEEALLDAMHFDEGLADYWDRRLSEPGGAALGPPKPLRLAAIDHNRAQLLELLGDADGARRARQRAVAWDSSLAERPDELFPADAADLPLLEVWTWRDRLVGEKLISARKGARLIVLQLSNEFMATDNIRVLNRVEREVAAVRQSMGHRTRPGLRIGITGSAAVGGDILRSAADSIRNTELFTIVLVVLILFLIYRSPLLIAIPLITISVSLLVSTSVVALLTQLGQLPGFGWWELKIFTTTRIFVVVILFGAGTDYCLFLISRYREELQREPRPSQALTLALGGVGDALAASALTTIVGLATMYFADFGKFRYSGPVIGLCLAITLLVCLTLTPALLHALGRTVFWPSALSRAAPRPREPREAGRGTAADLPPPFASADETALERPGGESRLAHWLWSRLARWIVAYPGRILVGSVVVLLPPAWWGFVHFTPVPEIFGESRVSYDLLNALADDRPSKQGARLLRRHYPVGEVGPLGVVVHQPELSFESQAGSNALRQLADALYVEGVRSVRCLVDPLGDYEPGEKAGVLSPRARRLRMLRAHPRTKQAFVTQVPRLEHSVTRLDLVLESDPFSPKAIAILRRVDERLEALARDPGSTWYGADFAYTGTTAGIRDLRVVTQSDNLRIEILVVLAVLAVLLVILRRPLVCLYMILSVLFSFYVTIGLTDLFFARVAGGEYAGLDWKVPLFLFVILVAIGQDYNVYLATRVFEEQRRYGPRAGLRRAVVRTGGIITSCGLIMAGTFVSMTSGAWNHWLGTLLPQAATLFPQAATLFPQAERLFPASAGGLRSIVELGFALALGVLLDTFVVRPILLPAFLSLLCRWPPKDAPNAH